MIAVLAYVLTPIWGPARMLSSYVILATVGSLVSALATLLLLPGLWHVLPRDLDPAHAVNAADSVGKPFGVAY